MRLPGARGTGVFSPLLLVAGLSLGALVLARCGGPGNDEKGGGPGGTEVAKAPGTGGDPQPGGAADPQPGTPGSAAAPRAVPMTPHRATPPSGGPEPAALHGVNPDLRRRGTPQDPRMKAPESGAKEGSAVQETDPDRPKNPKQSEVVPQPPTRELTGPSAAPVDPNAGASAPQVNPPAPGPAGPQILPPSGPSAPRVTPRTSPTAPTQPGGPTTGHTAPRGPIAPESPDSPEGKVAPSSGTDVEPAAPAHNESSLKDRTTLMDATLSAGRRAKAAERLGAAKAADAVGDLLTVAAQSNVTLRLRSAAIDALASIGDRYAVIGLKQLMAGIELGDLTLPSLVAGALRRRGAQRYLDLRARSELDDFSPRVRARGALIAGGAESLAVAERLIAGLADRAMVDADAARIAGRAKPREAAGVEVRDVAWRALVLISGGADYGFDADEWRGWLKRQRAKTGTPALPDVAAPTAGAADGLSPELRAAVPDLARVLRSRDASVVYGLVDMLRSHTDYARLASPPGDIYVPVAKQLPKFKSSEARDVFLASFYVAVFDQHRGMSASLAAGLAGAGQAGRTAYVAHLGAPGVQKLVSAMELTRDDPEAPYGAGGALLRLLDAFRGSAPTRPFLDPAGKNLDARSADALAFRDAVAEYGQWWRGLGVPHWDRATGRVVDGE